MKIYFDESGNTGQNLLDISQPIYVLTSHNFTEDETKEILKPLTSIGKEIHFKQLKKSYKYQQQLIEIFNSEFINDNRIKYYYADKKFSIVCQIVDLLIEPVLYNNGIDIYKKGLNIAYSNILFNLGTNIWNDNHFNTFLNDFQIMIRDSKIENIQNFYISFSQLYENLESEDKLILDPILRSKLIIKKVLKNITKYSIDLSLSIFTALASAWGKQINENIDVFHDDSKQIEFWLEYIGFFSHKNKSEVKEVGFDYRKINYPLPINSIQLVDSENCVQIQLADIISSSLSYCIKKTHIEKDTNDDFAKKIFTSKICNINAFPLMPITKLTPEELGTSDDNGINPLDYMVELAKNNHSEFKSIMTKIKK